MPFFLSKQVFKYPALQCSLSGAVKAHICNLALRDMKAQCNLHFWKHCILSWIFSAVSLGSWIWVYCQILILIKLMEILPVTSNCPDIILGPTPMKLSQFKPRAIALISVRLDWLYSSSPRKIHEVRDQGMEELPLAQPNCCYWSVGWCLGLGFFFTLWWKLWNQSCSITVGGCMLFSGSIACSAGCRPVLHQSGWCGVPG